MNVIQILQLFGVIVLASFGIAPFVLLVGICVLSITRSCRRFLRQRASRPPKALRVEDCDIIIEAMEVSSPHGSFPALEAMIEKALAEPRPSTTMARALSEAVNLNRQLRGDVPGIPLIVREVGSPAPYTPYGDPQYYQKEEHWRHKPAGT